MYSLFELSLFFVFIAAVVVFYTAVKVRELALNAALRHCKRLNLQLLDQTVALKAVWFKRDKQGSIRFWRSYKFEFSSMGDERYHGLVVMLGRKIDKIELQPYRVPHDDSIDERSDDGDSSTTMH